jgi:hypothetical protein
MACDEVTTRLPDWWAGTLPADERARVAAHLNGCDACRQEAGELGALWHRLGEMAQDLPAPALRPRFDAWLAGYKAAIGDGRERRWRSTPIGGWLPLVGALAALVLVAFSFIAGMLVDRRQPAPDVVALRQEVQTMRQMLALSLLQQQSANQRLRGLAVSAQLEHPDQALLAVLLGTLHTDPNVNVRLAAIDALRSFAAERAVRDGLVESLARPQSPLVQIALIDTLVDLQEPAARAAFELLASDARANEAVRARAAAALGRSS